MIIISKKECIALQDAGFIFGRDIHKTIGRGKNKTYYATESEKVMNFLTHIRVKNTAKE